MTFQILNLRHHAGICGAALTLALTASVPVDANEPAPAQPQAQYEIRFMTGMTDHHWMAVHMAMMCLEKAVHPELLETCAQIRDTQQQEIATMQGWLQEWYGVSYAPEMTNGAMQRMHRMHDMTAEEFEIAFMKSMIRHHWTAVVRATGCLDRAYHANLIAMCEEIVIAQVSEIETMRTWLCQWYGVCNYGPKGNVAETH